MAHLLGCDDVHLEYPSKRVFDALTLAHIILQDPTLKLAAALDTPMARR